MLEREAIIVELWERFADVEDIIYTARNPKDPPSVENLPCIQFFELGDRVVSKVKRGATQKPIYHREMDVIAEIFILGSTEPSATKELVDMVKKMKKQVYKDGVTLGGLASEIDETEAGRIQRPPVGGPVIGVGIAFRIVYVEDVGKLFL